MKKGILFLASFLFILISNLSFISATLVSHEDRTLMAGDLWALNDGYEIYVREVFGEMDKADIALGKGSSNLYEKWFSTGDTFSYPNIISATIIINYHPATEVSSVTFTDLMLEESVEPSGEEPSTGGEVCNESWQCSLWTACVNREQRRRCVDSNNCDPTNNETIITRECDSAQIPSDADCEEDWACTPWTTCTNNQQARSCLDINSCGTTENIPEPTRACDSNTDQGSDDDSSDSGDSGNSRGSSSSTTTYEYNYYITHPFLEYFGFNASDIPPGEMPRGPISFFSPFLYVILIWGIISLFLLLLVYIYTSSAFASIANRTQPNHRPGLAWLPVIGPLLIARKAAGMHWWPVLLLILLFIPFVNMLSAIALAVFFTIWMWKTFSALSHPGWWSLFNIIPVLGNLIFLILLGVAAWKNSPQVPLVKKKSKKSLNKS